MSQLPPHSIEAEDSVIGAVLLSQSVLPDVIDMLQMDDFFQVRAQIAWLEIQHMHKNGRPIDVVTLSDGLKTEGLVTAEWLLACQNATPAISTARHYAAIIVDAARRRRLIMYASQLSEAAHNTGNDLDDEMDMLGTPTSAAGSTEVEIHNLATNIADWQRDALIKDAEEPWLVPHILRPKWRVILVAGEGVGKATYMRQIGLHAAAGLDPHDPSVTIPPVKVLCIDAENPTPAIALQHNIANSRINLTERAGEMYQMWHVEGGMDLRQRGPRSELEEVLRQTRPQLLLAGPLYKLFRRGQREDAEQATIEFLEVIDDLRVRFGFALILEHHAPKAPSGAYREMGPFGSSALLRWPEFGLALQDHGEAKEKRNDKLDVELQNWRVPRVVAEWPRKLTRNDPMSALAWAPEFYFRRGLAVGGQFVDGEWTYTTPT